MESVNPLQTLGLALGAGFSSGLNLYATIATLGLLERYGIIHLPGSLQVLSHPWVLGIALSLYAIEFLADKIPYVDTVWDAAHTLIRPPAAALLAYGATVAAPAEWRWSAALLAGGVALTSHSTKASTRAAVNTSPEPFQQLATQPWRGRAGGLADLDGHRSSHRYDCGCNVPHCTRGIPSLPSVPVLAPFLAAAVRLSVDWHLVRPAYRST